MLNYQSGFGNYFSSESISGSLPKFQNSPQQAPKGLYAEQISGSAFTRSRQHNLRTWVYRIKPSVNHGNFQALAKLNNVASPPFATHCPPNPLRWDKLAMPEVPVDFIDGISTMVGTGSPDSLCGGAMHIYRASKSMERFLCNADGELLIIPQHGKLLLKTELGELEVEPQEIALIPRGLKFQVILLTGPAYGYLTENFGLPFQLPELGVIGANGLANPRDFLAPLAKYENIQAAYELICKSDGLLWHTKLESSPLDVVAWHGNYVPYKYDLRHFNTLGSLSFDHPDPSIFTVLTSPGAIPGIANLDFVIFPPRWLVAENTFRPPYFHRNIMSEFMGLICGRYDAKDSGFMPGGCSLHTRFTAHGPDAPAWRSAREQELTPQYLANTMAFMLESSANWQVSEYALASDKLQKDYVACWQDLPNLFNLEQSNEASN